MSDIIDRIDELVEHQLQQERSGYDHNINQDKCWHCGREWHGLPITQRIAQMYARRTYDESYSLAEDDSPILCHGSNFIGPMPAPPRASTISAVTIGCDVDRAIEAASAFVADACRTIMGIPVESATEPARETPTEIQLWDRDFNHISAAPVSNWESSEDHSRARFELDCLPPIAAVSMLGVVMTTDNPRRMWRCHQITTYEGGRSVMEIVDIQIELDEIQRLTTWPTNG